VQLSKEQVYTALGNVIDPELGINVVKLGLIYDVKVSDVSGAPHVFILMTLTTPGCPLSAVFDQMVRDALFGLPGLDVDHNIKIEVTFDPPWIPDMMDEEARAELGFD